MRALSRLRHLCPAVAAALCVLATPSTAPAATAVTSASTTVDVSCAAFTYHPDADWYFPAGTPKGLVWLQHGFARSGVNMADLAEHYAAAGYLVFVPTLPSADIFGCTLQNLGNNKPFLNNVATWFSGAANASGQLATSYARAAALAGRTGTALPATFLFSGHSAGGEAVEYVAQRLRGSSPATFAKLKGLVLLDPVASAIGDNTAASLAGLATTSLPVRTVSSPPYLCNSSASGTTALQEVYAGTPFVGVELTSGSHVDAEGASVDAAGSLACGTSQAKNISALQTLAVGWAADAFDGTTTATYYPGGTYYQSLLQAGTIETLAGAGG
ncbi:hypothetical protein ACIPSE_10625 [Streptomyces sp. NPDC090106]|uniref:hypothetical protein n=1 Tax=Streptomyces sp. NPDC090106 TaxID=3365946 RepID=UPI00381F4F41